MKIRTIICFIFSILGLLALVAYFFPEDGIAVGSVRMKFPSLTEVLQTEEEKEDGSTDAFPSGLHPNGIVCQSAVGKILELSCSETRHAIRPVLQTVCPAIPIRGLSFQW